MVVETSVFPTRVPSPRKPRVIVSSTDPASSETCVTACENLIGVSFSTIVTCASVRDVDRVAPPPGLESRKMNVSFLSGTWSGVMVMVRGCAEDWSGKVSRPWVGMMSSTPRPGPSTTCIGEYRREGEGEVLRSLSDLPSHVSTHTIQV